MIRTTLRVLAAAVVLLAAAFWLVPDTMMQVVVFRPRQPELPENAKPWEQQAEAWDWCVNVQSSFPERHVKACTLVIESGTETGKRLALAFEKRAGAYIGTLPKGPDPRTDDMAIATSKAARADYDEAIRLDPSSASAYIGRGYFRSNDKDLAIADFNEAIRLEPDKPDGFLARARLHDWTGEADRALADFSAALQRDSKSLPARVGRSSIFEKRRDYDGAIKEYDELIRLGLALDGWQKKTVVTEAYQHRGVAYFKKDDFERAIADHDEAIRELAGDWQPHLPPYLVAYLYYGRGLAKLKKGDAAGGDADIATAKKLNADVAESFERRFQIRETR
jgi:tetratricopeptide (TPR) repeat protein